MASRNVALAIMPLVTGDIQLDKQLENLRMRTKDFNYTDFTQRCAHHGVVPLTLYCHSKGQEFLCGKCMDNAWNPTEAEPKEELSVYTCCGTCKAVKALMQCKWCEDWFCLQCMVGESCRGCDFETEFPPEQRAVLRSARRDAMKGS